MAALASLLLRTVRACRVNGGRKDARAGEAIQPPHGSGKRPTFHSTARAQRERALVAPPDAGHARTLGHEPSPQRCTLRGARRARARRCRKAGGRLTRTEGW
uniref:Uncharacterized protein n=1 Tax=Aegilops tauschii subsp. strangulata TaxID=200361 RepID=A0A453SQ04_AEGTS